MFSTQNSDVPEPDPMNIDASNSGSVDPHSIEGIFLVALSKTGAERDVFLSGQCSDLSQRQRVEALLVAYEQAGNFLQKPAVTAEPTPIGQYLAPCELPGTLGRLGPYEILEEIGRGGMGVVFRAHDPKLQRIVAVKALAPELARLPSARQRFLREARAAAAISHPHVVTIFAVDGTEEASLGTERTTLPYLVMECVVGQTLHDKIKRVGALKLEEIVRISRQMAEGLGAAHKRGLIHRDIKPANILLENGVERVKITDFGLARMTSDGGITHTGEILGTPHCMSPEQARGEIIDQRSDLFSLGCVMYTMCTGVSPFRADNILAVMKKVCDVTPRPIAQLNSAIPEWLCELVQRLLEKESERRVQTAGEVVTVLETQVAASTPIASSSPVAATQSAVHLSKPPRAARSGWLQELCVVSALLGMLYGAVFHNVVLNIVIFLGLMAWVGIAFMHLFTGMNWNWVSWKGFAASMVSLSLGGLVGMWVGHSSRLKDVAPGLAQQDHFGTGVFILCSAAGTFWLLTRWFPRLFIQNRQADSLSNPEPMPLSTVAAVPTETPQPRSPWSVFGWMLVGVLGMVVIGGGLVFFAIAIPAYLTVHSQIENADMAFGIVLLEFPPGENVKNVTIDGQGVILRPGGEHHWSMHASPGPHTLVVDFDTVAALNQVKTYKTTINVTAGNVTDVEAVPVVESVFPNNELTNPEQNPQSTAGAGLISSVDADVIPPGTSISSIPLADAIEVLTDPAQMPAPATGMVNSGFGSYDEEMTQAVWIDEPGLLIRMKRLGFEGTEGADIEYYSKVAWGTGPFMGMSPTGEAPYHFPAGRYQVLVQDLDYGWPLDRRGTITIGNGPVYVHVKRSFEAHQLRSSGTDQFPLSFRWKGKTYQIATPEEVQIVNALLAATAERIAYSAPESFRSHPLFFEAVQTDPQGSRHSLKHERTLSQIDIQSADMQAGFMSPLGRLDWKGPRKTPEGAFVPRQDLRMFVKDELMGWNSPGWYDNHPIAAADSSVVVRRDRTRIKKFAETGPGESDAINLWFYWFGTDTDVPRNSTPAIRRLISAWADGQPDVPEAELLQLGGAASMGELWKLPTPVASNAPTYGPTTTDENEEPKTEEPKPAFVPPAFLVPGNSPGTWRMKEPPEGAVAP